MPTWVVAHGCTYNAYVQCNTMTKETYTYAASAKKYTQQAPATSTHATTIVLTHIHANNKSNNNANDIGAHD